MDRALSFLRLFPLPLLLTAAHPLAAQSGPAPSSEVRAAVNAQGGVDIYVTNTSRDAMVVTAVRVFDCRNVRSGSCAVHHPKVRLHPGQERRVLTIRFQAPGLPTAYRYQYWVEPAPPEG